MPDACLENSRVSLESQCKALPMEKEEDLMNPHQVMSSSVIFLYSFSFATTLNTLSNRFHVRFRIFKNQIKQTKAELFSANRYQETR